MGTPISIGNLPYDVINDILLQLNCTDDLKAAAQSCKAFHSTLLACPSILAKLLEHEIPRQVLPYAYALQKCRKEGFATASDEEKKHLLDIIHCKTFRPGDVFPGSMLPWSCVPDIRSFHRLVGCFINRAVDRAFRRIGYESRTCSNDWKLWRYGYDNQRLSKTEIMRFYLAFYRIELHSRLFATTHGARHSPELEANFFGRLTPWECEQWVCVSSWMMYHYARLVDRLIEQDEHDCDDAGIWAHFYRTNYAISLGLEFLDKVWSPISILRLLSLVVRHARSPLVPISPDQVTVYSASSQAMVDHMAGVSEDVVLEPGSESNDPDFGPRSALFAVRCDWRKYYNDSTPTGDGIMDHLRVYSVFYPFWDHNRIVGGDMLPFFARIAHEGRNLGYEDAWAAGSDIDYGEDYSSVESGSEFYDDSYGEDEW